MNPEWLRQLIQSGETLDVEFKGELKKPFSDDDLVKTVVCMANRPSSESGWILIGVEDDGRITGARHLPPTRRPVGVCSPARL